MFSWFESITRRAHLFSDEDAADRVGVHQFELRNIFEPLPSIVRKLFDDGHYAQATFECLKFVDREVARISGISDSGKSLMMTAFSEARPLISLTPLTTSSEKSEQEGYKFIFAGVMMAIRNPRGHEYAIIDTNDNCLDYLAFASVLLRRIVSAGYIVEV